MTENELPDTPWGHSQRAKLKRLKDKQDAAGGSKKKSKKKTGTSSTG